MDGAATPRLACVPHCGAARFWLVRAFSLCGRRLARTQCIAVRSELPGIVTYRQGIAQEAICLSCVLDRSCGGLCIGSGAELRTVEPTPCHGLASCGRSRRCCSPFAPASRRDYCHAIPQIGVGCRIMGFSRGQYDANQKAHGIAAETNAGSEPAARAAECLELRPPFPPAAHPAPGSWCCRPSATRPSHCLYPATLVVCADGSSCWTR